MTPAAVPPRGQVAQYVLLLRIAASGLPLVVLPHHGQLAGNVLLAVGTAFTLNAAALHWWPAFEQRLSGPLRDGYLALDVALGVVLLAVLGAGSPFVLYTVGTAALAGLLHGLRRAALATVVLCTWYVGVEVGHAGATPGSGSFHDLVTLPALYLVAGCGAVLLRRLLDQQAAAAVRLGDLAHRSAVADERVRMARDLHDSLTKSLHGLSLVAQALGRSAEAGDLVALRRTSGIVARVLDDVSVEARSTIAGLRADPDAAPFREALAGRARAALSGASVQLEVVVEDDREPSVQARHELLSVLQEALENIRRHAGASRAWVQLCRDAEDRLVLVVRDDGVGFTDEQAARQAAAGHFGLVGIRERVERVGGALDLLSVTGSGTCLTVRVPATSMQVGVA